ncbi:AraC family transcriptional regulator [Clostridium omnivorum]|uniref:AraC family transcriptional regulator n=1 Tax=Clostridium omnivorum TaxID=1604902 RepID=A0ABQ5N7C0_9CLOT|nr:AraC family transcriptional regulator [Clostridium sp. E14]GLC31026.1 AraC family transcriptional regulator [Clostridium sp. E14]
MSYVKTLLKEEFNIKEIVTVHYFEFAKNYIYEGESHNFWEFVYVDKGEVEIMADTNGYKLNQGEIIFHKPNEFHNLWANGKVAPNLIVISFYCNSPSMAFFENKILSADDANRKLLSNIVKEARNAFSSDLSESELKKLEFRDNVIFGCEQLIKIYLEEFLINLVRRDKSITKEVRLSSSVKERSDNNMTTKIIGFLQDNINNNLTFEDVCKFSNMSKTNLKTVFKEKTGTGVIEYFKSLKIEEAKRLIREEEMNFTQIADILGYSSIHYFSRHFKKATGMTLSDFAYSVKSL